ncbi:MAG TPA: hypothetical protein VKT21_01205 [Thermoplasmata archaeon]|nr:hypothetical protein [Thermoplasmata archaeon]
MGEELDGVEQSLLRHLLTYRGHQVRFEADAHTTEFGIYRAFTDLEAGILKNSLRQLENGRWIYRRIQYVIGFSEPKLVYSLTPYGYRKAIDLFGSKPAVGAVPDPGPPAVASTSVRPDAPNVPGADPALKASPHRREREPPRPKNE